MSQTTFRLSLTALALVASAALVQAQTASDRDAHHPGGPATAQAPSSSTTPPQAGTPMAGPMAAGGMPGTLPEHLAAYQQIMSAHIGRLERMEARAKPLYAALSRTQKTLLHQMTASPMGIM